MMRSVSAPGRQLNEGHSHQEEPRRPTWSGSDGQPAVSPDGPLLVQELPGGRLYIKI